MRKLGLQLVSPAVNPADLAKESKVLFEDLL